MQWETINALMTLASALAPTIGKVIIGMKGNQLTITMQLDEANRAYTEAKLQAERWLEDHHPEASE